MNKALTPFAPWLRRLPRLMLTVAVFGVAGLCGLPARAQDLGQTMRLLAEQQIRQAGASVGELRLQIEVGKLDEHLRLAPCARIEPQWPPGARPWGRVQVTLRCVEGPVAWKVYLPVTVRAFGRAPVAATALPAGTVLEPHHLGEAEVDLAASQEMPLRAHDALLGRALARPVAAGQAVRATDLRQRQWFAVGDVVRIVAVGAGFSVSGEGQAISAGLEGQPTRVRTESGRIVTGRAVAERTIEVAM